MEVDRLLIDEARYNYKCYDELKRLLCEDDKFKQIVMDGYLEGKIYGFNEELWQKISSQNIRRINSFEDVFVEGANIGYCTVASKQLSYSFDECYICGGVLPLLAGTKNCADGSHTWILHDGKVIDTTLMLVMEQSYAKKIGYIEENRYDPNLDSIYSATKKFTLDEKMRK